MPKLFPLFQALFCSASFLTLGSLQPGQAQPSAGRISPPPLEPLRPDHTIGSDPSPNASPWIVRWRESTPFPNPTAGGATGIVGDKMVVAGGTYWSGEKGHWIKKLFSPTTQAFDPKTETWERLPDAPIPFSYAAFATVRHKLYVMGGYTGSEVNSKILTLEKKDGTYVWSVVGKMPDDRVFAQAVSVGDRIYLLGGTTEFEPYDSKGTCCTSKTATSTLLMLDTAHLDRGWRQLAPYPGARRWSFTSETDGKYIWMFGGTFQKEVKDPVTRFDEVLRYEIASDRWERMDPLPSVVSATAPLRALRSDHRILLMSHSRTVWQLDLRTLRYSEEGSFPEEVSADKFVWFKNQILAAGGENALQGPRRRSNWTFIGEFVRR